MLTMDLPPNAPTGDPQIEIVEPLCAVFRRKLKSEGLKYTPERAHVLNTVIGFESLFDADGILDQLKGSGHAISKATVYRTIKLMLEAGIIQRVIFDEDHARYQLVYGRRPADLLIRTDTDEVEPLDIPELIELRDRICRERGLEPRSHRLHIYAAKA